MKRFIPAFVLLVLAAILMAQGVYRGEVETIFKKAIMICMECIGIG